MYTCTQIARVVLQCLSYSIEHIQVLFPIVSAIAYMHSLTIMHRDLKPGAPSRQRAPRLQNQAEKQLSLVACSLVWQPGVSPPAIPRLDAENVVVQGAQGIPKICDFGLALNWSTDVAVSRAGTPVGGPLSLSLSPILPPTPPAPARTRIRAHLCPHTHSSYPCLWIPQDFMAPEVVRLPRRTPEQTALLRANSRSLYDWRVDIWALGIFAYEMLFGRTPFDGAGSSELADAIQSQPVTFPSRGGHSEAAEAFIMVRE